MPFNYRDMEMIQRSLPQLEDALRRMQQERMAKEILGESLSTYKLRDMQKDDALERQYKQAQITRALREPYHRDASNGGQIRGYVDEEAELPEGFVRLPNGRVQRDPTYRRTPSFGKDIAKLDAAISEHMRKSKIEEEGNIKAQLPDVHYTGEDELERAKAERDALQRYAQPQPRNISPVETFQQATAPKVVEAPAMPAMRPQVAPQSNGPVTIAPAADTPLKARARKALADPNASEEAKAAARKILGQ